MRSAAGERLQAQGAAAGEEIENGSPLQLVSQHRHPGFTDALGSGPQMAAFRRLEATPPPAPAYDPEAAQAASLGLTLITCASRYLTPCHSFDRRLKATSTTDARFSH